MPTVEELPEYCTILAQCFSPDGSFLAVADVRGRVVVYNVGELVARRSSWEDDMEAGAPRHRSDAAVHVKFVLPLSTPVLAMASMKEDLVLGCVGEISGWRWADMANREPKSTWTIRLGPVTRYGSMNEVNWLTYDAATGTAGRLMVASNDNDVRIFDAETRQLVQQLQGHENYIHSISHCNESRTSASASEDGSVRLWDVRQSQPCITTLKPHERNDLARPKLGQWVGAVDLTSEWLACGGGPRAALWHLRTMSPNEALPIDKDNGIHIMRIAFDRVFIGGAINKLFQTTMEGHMFAEIPSSSSCVYNLAFSSDVVDILTFAGSSSRIDVCTPSFNYRQKTLLFWG